MGQEAWAVLCVSLLFMKDTVTVKISLLFSFMLTTLQGNSADDKLMLTSQKIGFDSLGDNVHEMSKLIFWEK